MKVAVTAHLLHYPRAARSGIGTYIRGITGALPSAAPDWRLELLGDSAWLRWRGLRVPYEQLGLPAAVRRGRPDVVHLPDATAPAAGFGCPSVVTIHDLTPLIHPDTFGGARARYKAAVIGAAARRAAFVVAVSEVTRRDVIRLLGADPVKVVTVPNGVSAAFHPPADEATTRARYDLPDHFLLAVGRLDPRKNLERLFQAYAAARRQHGVDSPLYVVGPRDSMDSDIVGAPARLGIAEAVRFTSYVPDDELVALYGTADALLYPSLSEGFGLPVLEAMACGAPVVTANVSALPEVSGDAALLVDPLDTDDMAGAIARVSDDEALRKEMRAAGLARAAGYSWDRTARATAEVYARALC